MQVHHLELEMFGECENTGDFLCGFFVGEMVGSALSAFQIVHQREPTADEHLEIIELVESHSKKSKNFCKI